MTPFSPFRRRELQLRAAHEMLADPALAAVDQTRLAQAIAGLQADFQKQLPPAMLEAATVKLKTGVRFHLDLLDRLGFQLWMNYVREYPEYVFLSTLVHEDDVFVDAGANFGLYAITAAKKQEGAGRVLAVDADPKALALLAKNVALNGVELTVVEAALSDHEGRGAFSCAAESSFSSLVATERSALRDVVEVRLATLTGVLAEQGLDRIDFLKIDVEGQEGRVLKGALEAIEASPDPVVMLEASRKNRSDVDTLELRSALEAVFKMGFVALRIDLPSRSLMRIDTPVDVVGLFSENIFLLRPKGRRGGSVAPVFDRIKPQLFDPVARAEFSAPNLQMFAQKIFGPDTVPARPKRSRKPATPADLESVDREPATAEEPGASAA